MYDLAVLANQIAHDAIIALPIAIARVVAGHLSEDKDKLSIAWKHRTLILVLSIALAIGAGIVFRESSKFNEYATLAVAVMAFSAQDASMILVAYSKRRWRDEGKRLK